MSNLLDTNFPVGKWDSYLGGGNDMHTWISLSFHQDGTGLIEEFWATDKIVSAVCHAPIALANAKEKIATLKHRINQLKIYALFDGYFLAPGLSAKRHSELPQNESLGEVIDASSIRMKSYCDQRKISQYFTYQPESVLIRFPGKVEEEYQGQIIKLAPSALKREGGFNSERYFELEIQAEEGFTSLPGQGVEVKLQYQDQTCWQILKREVSLVFQRKFKL